MFIYCYFQDHTDSGSGGSQVDAGEEILMKMLSWCSLQELMVNETMQ